MRKVSLSLLSLLLLVVVTRCSQHSATRQTPPVYTISSAGNSVVRGIVSDSSGAPLPGVEVEVTDDSGGRATTYTNANGQYRFAILPPGTYTVTASLDGLSPASLRASVGAGVNVRADLTLRPSSVAESIVVTGDAPITDVTSSSTSTSIRPGALPMSVPSRSSRAVSSPAMAAMPSPSFQTFVTDGLSTEQYAAIAENIWKETSTDNISTFSVDVDTASYSNIRRFLTAGSPPPADAVRIEEMLNYFSYDYKPPAAGEPFSFIYETADCPWTSGNQLVLIGVKGRAIDTSTAPPNNLVFLIDVSGSMGTPYSLPLIQQGLELFVDQVRGQDRIAIVTYAGYESLALASTSGADRDVIKRAVRSLGAGGSTNGAGGIQLAYKVAADNFIKGGNNRVILATDGDFNVGITDDAELQTLIETKREEGVFLTTLGVGQGNYKDARMEMLADKGNGNYFYLDSISEAKKVLVEQVGANFITLAKDVKLQVIFDPSVVAKYRLIGYENRILATQDFDDDKKDAGEVGNGHEVTALYELVPVSKNRGALATLRVRYKEPEGEVSRLIERAITANSQSIFQASQNLKFAAAIAEFGMLLRQSEFRGTATWDDVIDLARQGRGLDPEGRRGEFVALAERAKQLLPQSTVVSSNTATRW
jgi:Ca-activated chloride channel homolog